MEQQERRGRRARGPARARNAGRRRRSRRGGAGSRSVAPPGRASRSRSTARTASARPRCPRRRTNPGPAPALATASSSADREGRRAPRRGPRCDAGGRSPLEQDPHERRGEGDLPEGQRRAEVRRPEERRRRACRRSRRRRRCPDRRQGHGASRPATPRVPADELRLESIDVVHVGSPRVICCHKVDGDLVDPGPTASVHTLLEALGDDVPQRLLLTHIHLDHAGAAGYLVRKWPHLEVWVSEVGAPHLVDPSKLINSASRLYGDDMDRLWGEIVPVPQENIRTFARRRGRRRLACRRHAGAREPPRLLPARGRGLGLRRRRRRGADHPGLHHAAHAAAGHRSRGVAGVPGPRDGLEAVAAGPHALRHLRRRRRRTSSACAARSCSWGELAKVTDADGFAAALRAAASSAADPATQRSMAGAVPPGQQWAGLDRYWRKKAEREAAAG